MTLEKAIKILEDCTHGAVVGVYPTTTDALKLGIEALKSVRTGRKVGLHYEAQLLPGETKE